MDATQLGFTSNADGYMLTYRGKPIGGAGVMLPRDKPLHWRHAQANRQEFKQNAELEIRLLKEGNGQQRFLDAITRIDSD